MQTMKLIMLVWQAILNQHWMLIRDLLLIIIYLLTFSIIYSTDLRCRVFLSGLIFVEEFFRCLML